MINHSCKRQSCSITSTNSTIFPIAPAIAAGYSMQWHVHVAWAICVSGSALLQLSCSNVTSYRRPVHATFLPLRGIKLMNSSRICCSVAYCCIGCTDHSSVHPTITSFCLRIRPFHPSILHPVLCFVARLFTHAYVHHAFNCSVM